MVTVNLTHFFIVSIMHFLHILSFKLFLIHYGDITLIWQVFTVAIWQCFYCKSFIFLISSFIFQYNALFWQVFIKATFSKSFKVKKNQNQTKKSWGPFIDFFQYFLISSPSQNNRSGRLRSDFLIIKFIFCCVCVFFFSSDGVWWRTRCPRPINSLPSWRKRTASIHLSR